MMGSFAYKYTGFEMVSGKERTKIQRDATTAQVGKRHHSTVNPQ